MPIMRDEAVCIRRWDFSETSQTVSLFGREHGLLRGIAKGAKREKAAFSGGIELLTRGEVLALVRKGRDLATLTDWGLIEVFPSLAHNLPANRAGLYFADLIQHMLHEGDPHTRLYDELLRALRGLSLAESLPDAILRFQWSVLLEAGYKPIVDRDALTGAPLPRLDGSLAFSAEAGGTVHAAANGGAWKVRSGTIALLARLDADEPVVPVEPVSRGNMEVDEAGVVIGRANRLLAAYLRHIMGQELSTMRHLFGSITGR